MPPNDEIPLGGVGADGAAYIDPLVTGEELLERARSVARRIVEKVRKVTGDTRSDHAGLPTDEQPPVG